MRSPPGKVQWKGQLQALQPRSGPLFPCGGARSSALGQRNRSWDESIFIFGRGGLAVLYRSLWKHKPGEGTVRKSRKNWTIVTNRKIGTLHFLSTLKKRN